MWGPGPTGTMPVGIVLLPCPSLSRGGGSGSGGAKVGPAGSRALAVKTCAPAVGWSLGGESRDSSSQLTAKKSYLMIGTKLSFTFNLSVTVRYNRCDNRCQSYLALYNDGYI